MRKEIIDFHVHPYLTFEENLNMYKEEFNLSWEEAMEDLKKAGITKICGSVLTKEPYSGWEYVKKLNDRALEIKKLCGDFYIPGFHIHPGFVKESIEEVERFHELGFKLVGELVPYMHGWDNYTYASEELQQILDVIAKYDMVVSYHTMNEWQEEMETMIRNNPDITFVAAHPGQKADCVRHVDRMQKYKNVYLDISGTGLFRYGILKYLSKRVGMDRIIFGTDYPITPPKMYVEAVKAEYISEEERELVFYKNAERILKLN